MANCFRPILPIQASVLKACEPTDSTVWKVVAAEFLPFSSATHFVPRGTLPGGTTSGWRRTMSAPLSRSRLSGSAVSAEFT